MLLTPLQAVQMELQFFYDAPRVRQTLGVFGFIRTPMVGKNAGGGFVIPFLEVETVAESIVDAAYSTYGSTIYLPGPARYFAALVRTTRSSLIYSSSIY